MKKYTELKRNQTLQETNQSVLKDVCQEGTGIVGVKKIKNDYKLSLKIWDKFSKTSPNCDHGVVCKERPRFLLIR